MSRIFGLSYIEKQKYLEKYNVLEDDFHLGLCHLQSHLCLSTFGVFSPSTRHLVVTVGLLGLCASLSEVCATKSLAGICDCLISMIPE